MPHNRAVFDWMDENLADVLPTDEIKSYLYVGWCRVTKEWWMTTLVSNLDIEKVGLLEVFKGNFDKFKAKNPGHVEATLGSIADFAKLYSKGQWDMVYWDHGPEHAESIEMLESVTETLKEYTKVILYACPWGSCPQKEMYGNSFEKHSVPIYEKHFLNMGMEVKTFGEVDTRAAGEIVAWWIKE